MAWVVPTTRSTGYNVTAANWNELVNNFAHMDEVGRVEFTADVSITGTTVATANQIVSLGAISYQNVLHVIEFWCPQYTAPAAASRFIIRDSTTVLATVGIATASVNVFAPTILYPITPSAASHTYNIAAWVASGTGTVEAGTGGTDGLATSFAQGYIAVHRIPT